MLPIELLLKIVDHLAADPKPTKHLVTLSLASRTFTAPCQSHLFKELNLEGSRMEVPFKLKFLQDVVLDGNPSLLNYVQSLRISFTVSELEARTRVSWLLDDPTFKRVLELLGSLSRPPSGLSLSRLVRGDVAPSSILTWIRHSFFPSNITKLELTNCDDAPMYIFLLLPHLKELVLNCTSTDFDIRKEQYAKELDSVVEEGTLGGTLIGPPLKEGRVPVLEILDFYTSHRIIRQLLRSIRDRHVRPLVDLSRLRILKVCPHEERGPEYWQRLINLSRETLEEIHLTHQPTNRWGDPCPVDWYSYTPLGTLLNLSKTRNLRVLALAITTWFKKGRPHLDVVGDITTVLASIVAPPNHLTNLHLAITIYDFDPFPITHKQNWNGLCSEIIRLSSERGDAEMRLEVEIDVTVWMLNCKVTRDWGPYDHIEKSLSPLREVDEIDYRITFPSEM